MSNFTGAECKICKENFKDSDDVVVCPQCGTPYHRECYAKEGKCINGRLHEENKSWSQEMQESGEAQQKKCAACNAVNKPHALICESCGASLVDNLNFSDDNNRNFNSQNNFNGFAFNPGDKYCGFDPDETLDGDVKISEAADFIGTNVPYYLMLFKRMKETGRKISVNFICLVLPNFYFAHRKMWLEAVLTTVLLGILCIPQIIYSMVLMEDSIVQMGLPTDILNAIDIQSRSFQLLYSIASYGSLIVYVLAFLFANRLYYRHMQKKISAVKKQYSSDTEVSQKIISAGGTSVLGILAAFILQFLISAIIVYVMKLVFFS